MSFIFNAYSADLIRLIQFPDNKIVLYIEKLALDDTLK